MGGIELTHLVKIFPWSGVSLPLVSRTSTPQNWKNQTPKHITDERTQTESSVEALGDWGNRSPVSDLRYRQTLGVICSSSRSRTPCRCACRWAPPNQKQTKRIRCRGRGRMDLGVGWGVHGAWPHLHRSAKFLPVPLDFKWPRWKPSPKKQPQNQIAACVMGVIKCSKMGKNNRKG